MRTLCNWKKVRIVETKVCSDLVYMLIEMPLKESVSILWDTRRGKAAC